MSLHIECSLLDPTTGVLRAGSLVSSQTLASAGSVSDLNLVPNDNRPYVLRLVAEVKMWVSITPADPNPGADPRRLMLANDVLFIVAVPGVRLSWAAKA